MSDYLLVIDEGGSSDDGFLQDLRGRATSEGVRLAAVAPGVWFGAWGPRPPALGRCGGWTTIGDVFMRDTAIGWAEALSARDLVGRTWGRYVAVQLADAGSPKAVLRDPSGALDCVTWRGVGRLFVASSAPDWLPRAARPGWRIDYDRLATLLDDPLSAWTDLALDGPSALAPGAARPLDRPIATDVAVWTPARVARAGLARPQTDGEAMDTLRDALDRAVGALSKAAGPMAAEVSGGFDSSAVAASLVAADADVRVWLHAFGPDAEGDERDYVDALGRRLAINPQLDPRPEARVTEADLQSLGSGFRPHLNALDTPQDRRWADLLREAGVRALMTGKGGDPLFVEDFSARMQADLMRDIGGAALLSPQIVALARRARTSVWSVLAQARAARRNPQPPFAPNALRGAFARPRRPHPWLAEAEAEGLGPGKIYQIAGLAAGQTFQGPSPQTDVVDLLHPLLSTPVVETCLALPTWRLTLKRRDRALARLAFADRLPATIVHRRSKGALTAHYGRRIAASLDVLRPWLLDGRLAHNGVIDRVRAEALLRPDTLIRSGAYGEMMTAAAVEAWARAWEARLEA